MHQTVTFCSRTVNELTLPWTSATIVVPCKKRDDIIMLKEYIMAKFRN